jgi:flagellar biosynthesis/type III secretory pathway M-ring protein FliF/YscJ
MSVVVIIAIVVAALIVLAFVAVYVRRRGEQRQVLRKRLASEATGHRQEADAHATRAQELGPEAEALRREATKAAASLRALDNMDCRLGPYPF